MKIYLASFMEPQNFGAGRLIGVCLPESIDPKTGEKRSAKPFNLDVKLRYPQFAPSEEIMNNYLLSKEENWKEARDEFNRAFDKRLKEFCESVREEAEKQGKTPQEILDLKDGDTLCSWERRDRTHYRNLIGGWLEWLDYEVVYA